MTRPLWTFAEIADSVKGRLDFDGTVTGVSIDTRSLRPGDVFFALRGPQFDGHDFMGVAFEKGASLVVAEEAVPGARGPVLMVQDTQQALYDLARAARARSQARIVAVTGSVGKTSTKEMLRLVLETHGTTFASTGNLNNHWGVPLSLTRLPHDSAFAVFEIGMNHAGEISPLSRLVQPQVAVITCVAATHLAHFPSVAAIADAKAEIFAGLTGDAVAVLNADDESFSRLAAAAQQQNARVTTFGSRPDVNARLLNWDGHAESSDVTMSIANKSYRYRIEAPGRHHVMNSLAVAAVAASLDLDIDKAMSALGQFGAVAGRGQAILVNRPDGSFRLLDESYNASPASMRAALAVLGLSKPEPGGRRIAVMGDMLELGPTAAALHESLRDDVLLAKADLVFAVGPLMKNLFDSLPEAMRGVWQPTSASLAPLVAEQIAAGDIVLVKGSLGSRMKLIVDGLQALGHVDDFKRAANGGR